MAIMHLFAVVLLRLQSALEGTALHLSTMCSGHGCGDLCLIASAGSSFRHEWLEYC
jgi:hypothetical protein